jgi:hypothetical protein
MHQLLTSKVRISLLLLLLLHAIGSRAQKGPENLQEFAVGFSIIDLQDHSRSYLPQSPNFRPIQLSTWYPAAKVKTPMQFSDYFQTWRSPSILQVDSQHYAKTYREWLQGLGRLVGKAVAPDSMVKAVGSQPMRAGWNAPPLKQRFPLIISHGGGGDAFTQAIRNEYLASQGYVVVSVPLMNHSAVDFNRGSGEITSMLSMAQDIGFAIAHCRTLPNVNGEKIGFAGMHLQTGLTYQSQTGRLSATVVFEDGMSMLSAQPFYNPKNITIPVLAIGSDELRPDFSLLDSLQYAERFVLRLPGLRHTDNFQNEKIATRQQPGPGKNYDTLNLFIRQFFDCYLKQKPAAQAFYTQRSSARSGPEEEAYLVHKKARSPLPAEGTFLAMMRYGRLNEAKAVYAAAKASGHHKGLFSKERLSNLLLFERFHKNTDELFDMTSMLLEVYPSAPVGERFLNSIGYAYLREQKLQQSIAAFTLGAQHYPRSPNSYDALADAYAAAGNKEQAIAFARKTLELLPSAELGNEAKQRIEQSARKKLEQFGANNP